MARDRKGAQLSVELDPVLLHRLRARAAADGRPVSTLVRRWIEAGLAAEPNGGDASDLAASLERLRGDVELGSARLSRCMDGQAQLLQRLGALEQFGLSDLSDRLGRVEAELDQLCRLVPIRPASPAPRVEQLCDDLLQVQPATKPPAPQPPDPPASGITTAELAERTRTNRAAWNNWARDKKPGAVRKMPPEVGSWRLLGKGPGPNGGPERWLWGPV